MALTGLTYALGEGGAFGLGSLVPVLVVLAFSGVKAMLVMNHFLEMSEAPALWRWLLRGWLGVLLVLLVLAYGIALW